MPIDRRMDKEDVVHIYMEYYSAIKRNEMESSVENGLEDMGWEKGKLGRSERVTWTYIHYQM